LLPPLHPSPFFVSQRRRIVSTGVMHRGGKRED
jgi:hypothetical protein